MIHVNRNRLLCLAICFFYVKSISVKSRNVAIKKLFWITETGTYSRELFPQGNYKVLDNKLLALTPCGCKRFLSCCRTICQQCVNIDVNLL
ncbi:hypothetical protein EGH55_14125 [Klebsiella aerogenes]|nr:hypothetical protein EGH55_14125 [Klebsiella aerogenes]